MLKHVLVTFDIDGTIFGSDLSLGLQRASFAAAFKAWFNREPDRKTFYGRLPSGCTEYQIAESILRHANLNPTHSQILSFLSAYDRACLSKTLEDAHTFPGVENLLATLKQMRNVHIALATGCTEKVAKMKVNLIGFDRFFTPWVGGFGESGTRSACISKAKTETERVSSVTIDHVIHIGDTPGDVRAAHAAKAHSFAVLTGIYGKSAFPPSTMIIDDMSTGGDKIIGLISRLQQ